MMNGISSLAEHAHQLLEIGLRQAIVATGWAALLAVPVLVINGTCRRWLSAGQMGLLWALVLVRLVLPVAPATVLSLQTLVTQDEIDVHLAQQQNLAVGGASSSYAVDAVVTTASAGRHPAASTLAAGPPISWLDLVPLVWLAGAVTSVMFPLIAHWRLLLQVHSLPVVHDPRLLRLWIACCDQAGIKRPIAMVIVDGLCQPAVMGAMRPRLLLTRYAAALDDEQLRLVMLHELAHVRRRDVAINWALMALRACHWWNPVYWLAAARFASLREQACDAFAIRAAQPTVRD